MVLTFLKRLMVPLLVVGLLLTGCEESQGPTEYGGSNPDPNPTGATPATISAVNPPEGFLRQVITIQGSGFQTTPEFNLVRFGTRLGKVISATATQLEVEAPNLADDTVMVQVAIKGSELWSNEESFRFLPTLSVVDDNVPWAKGVAVDANDNIYVGSANDGVIYKYTPAGDRSVFVTTTVDGAMEFGPNEWLYVCDQGAGEVKRISPDGATIETVTAQPDFSPVDVDWHSSGDMYFVGNGQGIFRLTAGGQFDQLSSIDNSKAMRIFENTLYVTDIWNNQILKYDITPGGLENETQFISWDPPPAGIEVDKDGVVYFSPAWDTHLVAVYPDGSTEILYEGELMTPMRYLTFYKKSIYIVFPGWGDIGTVMSAYIGVDQAPNHGRN